MLSLRERVRAGDPDAFGELFDSYARPVYNHAYRLTGDWSVAEDVVSLCFLEAWRLRGGIDDSDKNGSLRPWLLGIATNTARNVRRAARRHQAALARLPAPRPVPDVADDVAARLDDQAQLERTRTALAGLRRGEREVLALCVWGHLDYAQAAQALGVPVGTVRSRLSRARAKLARLADPGAAPDPCPARRDGEPRGADGQVRGGCGSAAKLAQEDAR